MARWRRGLKRRRTQLLASLLGCLILYAIHTLSLPSAAASQGKGRLEIVRGRGVQQESPAARAVPSCTDHLGTDCVQWASRGECDSNPAFMLDSCPLSCGGCPASLRPNVQPLVQLVVGNASLAMPAVGFGTAGLGDGTAAVVAEALKAGYHKLDTAQAREWYREDLVGAAIAAASIPRHRLFITTKVHPRDFGRQHTRAAVLRSLADLQTNYLDQVLLHYAECWGSLCEGQQPEGTWRDAWAVLEGLVHEDKVLAIGVSNFDVSQLAELVATAHIPPSLLQLNSEPLHPATAEQAFCRRHGIQFESYSTLGGQYLMQGENLLMSHPVVTAIAAERQRAPAQVVLRWALQSGQTVVPRTTKPHHMRENLNVFDFELSESDMERLAALAALAAMAAR